ncbi:protein of unknown function [Marivirga sericea]|uniref:TolB-like 6-blade propeller-like n=1 Tax=Marivirga sericea TaxID=1028 RepID=A0A1X7L9W5_9BACT|nr:DUF4221 family protein [Marivirga sericea]SMG50628.1 protein of unknown function [Marivirga sericea]
MKYFFLFSSIVFTLAISSCNQDTKQENAQLEINITIDSVMVDSKGEIIDTKYGLNFYGLDTKKNFMYKFNTNNRHGLEVIDMNKMQLVKFIPFEVEGPNGTTARVDEVNYISEDKIAITNSQSVLIFNMKAELVDKYPIDRHEFEGDAIPEDFRMESSGLFVPEKKISFNLINKGFGDLRGFAKLNFTQNTRKVFFIDELKKLSDYHISLTIDGRMMMIRSYIYTNFQEDLFILSHDMENELYYYDFEYDSVIHKKYRSQLSKNKNEVFGKDVESREAIGKIMSLRNKGIRFQKLVYDETRNQYYRFSSYSTTPEQGQKNRNIILTIFDENLNQIKETDKIALNKVPETYFVKDGKIYIYKNMDDEMGFIVLSLG